LAAGFAAFGALTVALPATAAWQPTRTVEFIVPAGTGGGADQMARMIQGIVQKHNLMPQSLVVINKAGGAGAEGFLDVKGSNRNPHKIIITLSNLFTTPLATGVPFKWEDMTPVAMLALDEFVLWVNAKSPYNNVKDYIEAVKKGGVKMGGTGSKQEDQIITAAIGCKGPYHGDTLSSRSPTSRVSSISSAETAAGRTALPRSPSSRPPSVSTGNTEVIPSKSGVATASPSRFPEAAYRLLRHPAQSSPSPWYIRTRTSPEAFTSSSLQPCPLNNRASATSSASSPRTAAYPPERSYSSRRTRMNCPVAYDSLDLRLWTRNAGRTASTNSANAGCSSVSQKPRHSRCCTTLSMSAPCASASPTVRDTVSGCSRTSASVKSSHSPVAARAA
jgi:hypothetical protein